MYISLSLFLCHYDWLMSTAETTASNSMFRNGSICAMKAVPGRTTQNSKLLYLYRKGDVIRRLSVSEVTVRSKTRRTRVLGLPMKAVPGIKRFQQTYRNSTIKDDDARECWDLRDKVVTWQQTLSSDALKQNISHAGGANECTVTTLFVCSFFPSVQSAISKL